MKLTGLPILIFILVLPLAFSDKVVVNNIGIESDKHIYYCQPIFNEKNECLITAQIKIENNKSTADYKIKATYSTFVADTQYYLKEKYDSKTGVVSVKDKIKLKKEDDKSTIVTIKKDEVIIIDVEFFTLANGKFNISVSDGIITTTLDPIYNISVSATYPSYWLQNGFVLEQDIYNSTSITDVTAGLSDGLSNTSYSIAEGHPLYYSSLGLYFPMNCISTDKSCDNSPYNNPIFLKPNSFIVPAPDYFFKRLNISSAVSSGAIAPFQSQYQIGSESFTICARVTQTATGAGRYVFSTFDGAGSGYGIYFDNSARPHCVAKDDNSAEIDLSSAIVTTNGNVVNVCCRRNITAQTWSVFVNTTLAATNTGSVETSITTYGDLTIGSRGVATINNLAGQVDEIAMWKTALTNAEISNYVTFGASDNTQGRQLQPFFNRTFTANNSYYLHIDSPSVFPLRIYSMINSTHINTSAYYETQIIQQNTYVPLSSITYYGYNLPLRLFSLNPENATINNVYLIETLNDTIVPNISSCAVNDSVINCTEGINFYCHITDNGVVKNATFTIDFGGIFSFSHSAAQNPIDTTLWEVKLTRAELMNILDSYSWAYDSAETMTLSKVVAEDLGNNQAINTSLPVSSTYDCIACVEDWIAYTSGCLVNDTNLKYYLDDNNCGTFAFLPIDNGTYTSCNYCSEEIVKNHTSSCYLNGTTELINFSYIDNNYYSCCAITGIFSDCSILFEPYNITNNIEPCTILESDFEVDYPATCEFDLKTNDKCYWKIHITQDGEWKCVSYVRTSLDELIQTNPPYTAKSDTLITLKGTEYEDRTYFSTANGLANIYFTKENLIFDGRSYVFSVECSDGNQTLKTDKTILVEYAKMSSPLTRLPFLGDNAFAIVAIIIGIVIVLILGFWAWRLVK